MTVILFVIVALQLAVLAMIQYNLTGQAVREMSKLLQAQNERLSAAIQTAVQAATDAAHRAYDEANTVNTKISDLNARILHTVEQRDESE